MSNKPLYFRGQGGVKTSALDANNAPVGFRSAGNVPDLKVELSVQWLEHRESQSGNQLMDAKIPKSSDCKVTFTLETTLDLANQALAFYGSTSTGGGTGATTFTGKVLPATMQVGFDYMFGPAGATITSLVDSSTTPVTVAATDYTVNRDGTLTINNLATYKLPLIASGNLVAYNEVNILDQPTQDIALIFNGLNTMTGKAVVVKFPRIRLNPAKSVSFIGNDWVKYELEGQALADPQAIADAAIADDALLGYGSVQFVE